MRYYEYRHIVSFQETNLVGNVYFANHIAWQGRCRELFLRERAPGILDELSRDLSLATISCSCEYFSELRAFDEVVVRMSLAEMVQNRLRLGFEFRRSEEIVARGEQQIACMRRQGDKFLPTPVPQPLREALAPYTG